MPHEDARSSCLQIPYSYKFNALFYLWSGPRKILENMTSEKRDRSISTKNTKTSYAYIFPDGFAFVINVRLMIEMRIYGSVAYV